MSPGLLAGVKVVELGNLIAGPYAGMLLADLGAEVVKVEPPDGDLSRRFGPYRGGESLLFMAVNRGKRSIAIDPKDPDARPWLDRLVAGADVLIDNLRRGAMERMGYDDETLARTNPGSIRAVVSAFGSSGPYADRAGIDVVFQAESGMIAITGEEGDPPHKTATTVGDYLAATNAALTICAALVERSRTGTGRRVDISLRDGLLAIQSGWWSLFFESGGQPSRTGTASPFLAPNQVFSSGDGHFALAIVSDRHFELLCRELGRPDLADAYPDNRSRLERRAQLVKELEDVFATATSEEWVDRLDAVGLPAGRILDFPGVLKDPQVTHNEMVIETEHPTAGRMRSIGSPLRVDGRPAIAGLPPPILGEHSREVLAELGADVETIDGLVARGAVVAS